MMFKILRIFIFSLIIFTAYGGVSVDCPGTGGSCRCTRTDEGIHCPEGFYCPVYSTEQITRNRKILRQADCEVNETSTFVQCPCTPGFYCPENTETPTYCCEGFFCPEPSRIKECGRGHFCKVGYVEELDCGSESACPEGSSKQSSSGLVIALLLLVAALYIVFLIKYYAESKVQEYQRSMTDTVVAAITKDHEDQHHQLLPPPQESSIADDHDAIRDLSPNEVENDLKPTGAEEAVGEMAPHTIPTSEQDAAVTCAASSAKVGIDNGLATKQFILKFTDMGLTLRNGIRIMQGVSGTFHPQRLCAIMGPSGCGKTTIMSLITGKAKKTHGKVYVNDVEVENLSKWKKLVGYVPQEDVMIRQLTVRQNIEFSAMYRLPVEMSHKEKISIVNETLISLGIDHVQHSLIGDERERGISGGQRKRVNVGIEIVAKPRVLFLDEPTSGLDSTSSVTLAKQLKDIAVKQGVTIAGVIHQPSIPTIMEFDDLLLLGKGGQVIYHGPIATALEYFHSIGFAAPTIMNPADFFLDVASGIAIREDGVDYKPSDLFQYWEVKNNNTYDNDLELQLIQHNSNNNSNNNTNNNDDHDDDDENDEAMDRKGNKRGSKKKILPIASPEYFERLSAELHPLQSIHTFLTALISFIEYLINFIIESIEHFLEDIQQISKEWLTCNDEVRNTPGFWGQFYLCAVRAAVQKYRRFGTFLSQMLIHLLLAVVVGSVSDDLQYVGPLPDVVCLITTQELRTTCTQPLIDSYQSVANFLCIGILFAAISVSTSTFGDEQVNYWRECAAGLKTPPYFFAKWLIDVPNIILAATFYSVAYRISFPNTNTASILYELLLAFYAYSWSVGYVITMLAPSRYVFLVGVLFALLVAVAFSGTNPTISNVRNYSITYRWLWSISGPRWMLEGFYISQLKYYETVPSGPLEGDDYMNINAGLNNIGYNINNFSKDITALYWNAFGWGLFSLFLMMFTNSGKKR